MNIPVYYHIPKCGGVYVLSLYQHLSRLNERNIRLPLKLWTETTNRCCRVIKVYINNSRYIEMTGIIEIDDLLDLNADLESYSNIFSIKELYELVDTQKIKITSIFIQPCGDGNMIESRKQVDQLLCYINKKPIYFTTIREIFDRLYSEYSYMLDSMSDHEPDLANYRGYDNFEKFLIECEAYNNIISRHIAYDIVLDKKSFENVKVFFDHFTISTMQSIKETAIRVWQQCYGWVGDCTDDSIFYKNKNINKKKLLFDDISLKAKDKFLSQTEWDRELYAYLSQT